MKFFSLLLLLQSFIYNVNSIENKRELVAKKFLPENCNFNSISNIRVKLVPTNVYPMTTKMKINNNNDIIDKNIDLYLNIDKDFCSFLVKKYKRIVVNNNGSYFRPRYIFFYGNSNKYNNCIDFGLYNLTLINNKCYVYNKKYFNTSYIEIDNSKLVKQNNNTTTILIHKPEESISDNNSLLAVYIAVPIFAIVLFLIVLYVAYRKRNENGIYNIEEGDIQKENVTNNETNLEYDGYIVPIENNTYDNPNGNNNIIN